MDNQTYTGTGTDFYYTPPDVVKKINLAVKLRKPILVEGEPGCGKTRLAYSIAAEIAEQPTLTEPIKIAVKSTSRAQDLLYKTDYLKRLQDAQTPQFSKAQHIYPYISLGSLGKAIQERKRYVVLIDEIDKADIDFPNDLLDVLDTLSFQIEDLPDDEVELCKSEKGFGKVISAQEDVFPIIVITSNREKRLPEPFLRRCVYIRLSFPSTPTELLTIVTKNTRETVEQMNEKLLNSAIDIFIKIRSISVDGNAQKPPTPSELIDWIKILHWEGETIESLTNNPTFPPYWDMLFKTMHDLDLYKSLGS